MAEVGIAGSCEFSDRPLLRDFDLAVSGSDRDAVVLGKAEGLCWVAVVVAAAKTGPWSEAMELRYDLAATVGWWFRIRSATDYSEVILVKVA